MPARASKVCSDRRLCRLLNVVLKGFLSLAQDNIRRINRLCQTPQFVMSM